MVPTVPCACCGQSTPRAYAAQEWGFCAVCQDTGCAGLGNGDMLRGSACPLVVAVAAKGEVCLCLNCNKPLHASEPLTFIDNSNPSAGGCHARCVTAYWVAQKEG